MVIDPFTNSGPLTGYDLLLIKLVCCPTLNGSECLLIYLSFTVHLCFLGFSVTAATLIFSSCFPQLPFLWRAPSIFLIESKPFGEAIYSWEKGCP